MKILDELKSKFPDARIYVSSIFTRKTKETELNKIIKEVNTTLENHIDITEQVTYIDNQHIVTSHLCDDKHIDTKGLFIFLCNIRFNLFGDVQRPQRRTR